MERNGEKKMLTMKRKNLLLSTTIDWRRDVVDILPLLQGIFGDGLVDATTTISETERIHFKGTLAALQVVGILMDSAVCAQRGGQPNCGAKEETRSRWWMGQLFASRWCRCVCAIGDFWPTKLQFIAKDKYRPTLGACFIRRPLLEKGEQSVSFSRLPLLALWKCGAEPSFNVRPE